MQRYLCKFKRKEKKKFVFLTPSIFFDRKFVFFFLYCSFFLILIYNSFFNFFIFFCVLFVFCSSFVHNQRTTTKKCWSCFEYMFIFVNQEHISLFQENPKDIVYIDSVDLLGIDICWRIATEAPSELFLDCD